MSTDNNVMVVIKIINNSQSPQNTSKFCRLNINNNLSDIRKKLKNSKTINDIDTLLFSKKEGDEFVEITEEDFPLEEIIEVINKTNSKSYYLYLMKSLNPRWKILNEKFKLDYGRTMSSDGIKIAKKRAFILKDCELIEFGANGYKKGRLGFESKEDWMKKSNLFVNVDGINVHNFVEFGLSIESSQNKNYTEEINSTYQYTEIAKVSLKFDKENLVLTDDFKNKVTKAIQSKDHRSFREITEDYGQFIPTEIIFGGRVCFKDIKVSSENSSDKAKGGSFGVSFGSSKLQIGRNSGKSEKESNLCNSDCIRFLGGKHPDDENFDEKCWIESLKDYQDWDCIEFKNPINIFQLLSDNLYKKSFISLGKKILYTDTKDYNYVLYGAGMYQIFELNDDNIPSHISKIIQNKNADCDIFASVINTKNSKDIFFNCQIFHTNNNKSNEKPSIIIHSIQKESKEFQKCEYKLKIKIMIIGYDINFSSNIRVELIKKKYNSQNQHEYYNSMILQPINHNNLIEKNIPFFGIPILSNFNSSNNSNIIGHNFCKSDNGLKIYTFSYCSKKNCYVNLPKFTFCTLIILDNISNTCTKLLPFEFSMIKNKPFINLEKFTESLDPKWISLYLPIDKDYYNPIFYNQKKKKIKVNYVDCKCNKTCLICKNKKLKISNENNAICIIYSLR
ncbi:unnamed protein product [Rhizophagus irregularis]|uniref:MACPF domain-containing protein n=1 Tax=Rhizophagus irregularis TaxID=588596 RepID=A0A915Z549_9GLOM|nr:unnamed protein product [Rhizophagus irregularis]CAB5209035.1 unnamed protein product [Rhizophagus irregularis]CAB5361439.1 unnamed protein product [Rhizophagus irregularis]